MIYASDDQDTVAGAATGGVSHVPFRSAIEEPREMRRYLIKE